MKKLFTTILMMGVALCTWASYTADYADGSKTLTINYVDDGNSNLNVNDLIKEHMRNAETLVLTGDWANKDLATIGNLVARLIKTDGPDANPNKKIFLNLSACSKMKSKVVKADGTYNADIDWVTTQHKFIPTGATNTYTVDVTKNNVTETKYICEGQTLTMPEGFDPDDHTKTYSPFTFNGWDGTIFYDNNQNKWFIQLQYYAAGIDISTSTTTTWTYEDENGETHELQDWQVTDNGDGTYSYSYSVTDAVFKFSDGAFSNSEKYLGGIAFPSHADFNYIPAGLFKGSTGLTSVTFGSYTEWIGSEAFSGCTALTDPVFPATMKVFAGDCFKECNSFTKVDLSLLPKIQVVDYMAFGSTGDAVATSNLAEFILPKDNTSLKYFANYVVRGTKVKKLDFTGCKGIKNFAHDGKATFGEFSENWDSYWTFYGCSELTTVILPPNLSYLTVKAFNTCPKLQSVTFLGDAVYNKSTCVEGGTNTITNPLIIDEEAFKQDYALTEVIFCNRITEIRKEAFMNTALTSINIPASVEVIGVHAFSECTSLAVVTFDEIDSECAPCKHAKTVIAGEHKVQATDPDTGELLFNEDGTPQWVKSDQQLLDENGQPVVDEQGNPVYADLRVGDGDGAFFHCPVTDVYINAVDADIICENKAFDYNITFGQTDPNGHFATLHYPEGEEEKYVNLSHFLSDEIAYDPGAFQAWLLAHFNAATIPNNNGWHEFINSGPSTKNEEPPFEEGDMFLRTYSDPNYARIVPKGVKAYIVKAYNQATDGSYELTLQSIPVIPAQTGVILYGQPNANAQGGGKTLAMTAVEFEEGDGEPLRRDYWDKLPTGLTQQEIQNGLTEPDNIRLKNYLMPIIANCQWRTVDGNTETITEKNLLTVLPYEKVNNKIAFRNFALNRISATKTLKDQVSGGKDDNGNDVTITDGAGFNESLDYAGFFRILKGTYDSGYAYLHFAADEYTAADGAECVVIKDNDYTKEYDGTDLVDFGAISSMTENPHRLWQYAKWEERKKNWGKRAGIQFKQGAAKFFGEFEDETDGIVKLVVPATESGVFYNLQGVKVVNPTKGIYIQNGKKVVIK